MGQHVRAAMPRARTTTLPRFMDAALQGAAIAMRHARSLMY
ncbi:hypothetical protein MAXJ12_26128 [Mesorhizobium alhagi CCNWXJ12-2]|uniref:Uncharacterized protein n=1 Tax=Mesorhizobium alhagi CCNWXJ12-2 TaxID=1107882 RepID=H0HYE7_9HYPH|nr:hypothetical protein MAXJ12_26128 [Mesorhizobium alhagi CCNWXJ12-2]